MTDLIDTHQHLIYRDAAGYGWTADVPPLAEGDFTVPDYQALAGTDVSGTLFMEAAVDDADYRAETRFVAGLMREGASGLRGIIASCRPEEASGFDAWLDECADLGVVGYRRVLHVMPDDLSDSDVFRANLSRLGARGIPFDLCLQERQLPIGHALAEACGDTTFVLDHLGVPSIGAGTFDTWRAEIDALAALPNMLCKMSGVLAYCPPGEATRATIQPYVDHALGAFGANRMLWGSDWPVVNLANGLPDWLQVTQAILADLPDSDAAAIASGTATRIYGLG